MVVMTTTTSMTARPTARILFGNRILQLELSCCLFVLVCSNKGYRRNGDLHSKRPYPFAFRVPLHSSQSYLPFVHCDVPSTLEDPNPTVTSGQFLVFLGPVLLLMYSHSDSHVHPIPSSQRRSLVPAVVDKAQEYKAYSDLTITMRCSKIRNKDVHVLYFTSSCASHIPSPPSKTSCWTVEPEDLYLHWQGPSNVKAWIWECNGCAETGGAWRPIQAGYPHLACQSIGSMC